MDDLPWILAVCVVIGVGVELLSRRLAAPIIRMVERRVSEDGYERDKAEFARHMQAVMAKDRKVIEEYIAFMEKALAARPIDGGNRD